MTIFEAVKSRVTLRNAAERFGLTVTHDGRARCPFHDDWHLSLKLTDKTFFCSGCGASGDVIEFTSRLLGIAAVDAAKKLYATSSAPRARPSVLAKLNHYRAQVDREKLCFCVLREYLQILQNWERRFSPRTPDEAPDPRFVEARHMLECMRYMLDLLTVSSPGKRMELVNGMMKDNKIALLQERIRDIREEADEQK